MQKKSTKAALIVGAAFLLLVFVVGFIMSNRKPKTPEQKVKTFVNYDGKNSAQSSSSSSEKVDTTNPSEVAKKLGLDPSGSSNSSATSESQTTTSTTPTKPLNRDVVKQVMNQYVTVTLDDKALDNRQTQLKNGCSDALYQSLKVATNTQLLKTMWKKWQDKKELDTNQPVQLTNQSIQSLNVFQNVADESKFIVKAEIKIQSPASPNSSILKRDYTVEVQNGKLTLINKDSEVAQKNE